MAQTKDGVKKFVNCTLSGPVEVHVEDERIVRIMPLNYKQEDAAPWTIEARGETFTRPNKASVACWVQGCKQQVYSKDRILTPLKRVDFDPNGERNPGNRGVSGYEPISWDEAMTITANEITRLRQAHGPSSIAVTGSSHDSWGNISYRMSALERFWNLIGCTWIDHDPDSWQGWYWGAIHAWGYHWRLGQPPAYDLLTDTFEHTEMIVFWSSDPNTTSGDYAWNETDNWRFHMKKLGIKFVFIDPFCNFTSVIGGDKWIAPKPGTDTTLALAIAYTWLTENKYDKEYVDTHTYGFDKWKAYVLGEADGIPKTPKWAEGISGVKARDIIALAREWASKKVVLAAGGRSGMGHAMRAAYGHEWARMMVLLQGMQGLGKPGVSIYSTTGGAPANWDFYFPGYADGGIGGGSAGPRELGPRGFPDKPTASMIRQRINRAAFPSCVLEGKFTWRGVYGFYGQSAQQQFQEMSYPFEGYSPVKMIFRQGASYIGTMMDTNRWAQAYRHDSIEFVVSQTIYNEPEARFADIIFPACTNFERDDIGEWARISGYSLHLAPTNARVICHQQKAIEPRGESKSDYDIYTMLADKLGFKEKFTEGRTELDWCKRMYEVSDLPKVFSSWEEFSKKGYYIVPVPEKRKVKPAFRFFAEDRKMDTPDWGPGMTDRAVQDGKGFSTPSGKIEYEAQNLVRFDPNDQERPPVPHYIPSWEGIDSTELLKKYPLQLISPHPRFSFHTQMDGKSLWNEEIVHHRRLIGGYRYWVLRMNKKDADARGLKDGDIIKVWNDRGAVACALTVTNRLKPGIVHSYSSGGGYDPQGEPGNPKTVDKGGTINQLVPSKFMSKNCAGMAPGSCLVQIEKWQEGSK
jgi:anaerobic selenocysteine-containing dehydrogenase